MKLTSITVPRVNCFLATVVLNNSFDIFSKSTRIGYGSNSHHFTWHLARPNYNINGHYNYLFSSGPFLIVSRGPKCSGGSHIALAKH